MPQTPSGSPKTPSRTTGLASQYDELVAGGNIRDDAAQRHVLQMLEGLTARLASKNPLSKLFRRNNAASGIYIWGAVGRGKSMLMDLFFNNAPVIKKRRVHFHAFMQEVHNRIHALRQEGQRGRDGADPVVVLARQLAEETSLLCFDELQATDVADATLLYRLFQGLFDSGVVVVSTSNHPPASLYTGGVQRERFAKFITLLEDHMQIASLTSPLDYRHEQMRAMDKRYSYPLGAESDEFVADAIEKLCTDSRPHQVPLAVKGRAVKLTLYDDSIALASFHELCEVPLGPADYLALANRCDTVILTGIPKLPPEKRNEAKRFVTLIDALYEHKVRLLCTAAVAPEAIYEGGDGSFEFKRTVSRLAEMQSAKWGE